MLATMISSDWPAFSTLVGLVFGDSLISTVPPSSNTGLPASSALDFGQAIGFELG